MHRLLTHSSSPTAWLEECAVFYSHLRNIGYPSKAIDSTFRTINWNQRSKMLEPKKRVADDTFFAQYRGCVFSNRNAPGSAELQAEMDRGRAWTSRSRSCGNKALEGQDIFPPRAFFALRSALPMVHLLPR